MLFVWCYFVTFVNISKCKFLTKIYFGVIMKSFIFSILVVILISNSYLKADYLYAWGNNDNGQIGDGTNINRNSPVLIDSVTEWKQISSGIYHNLAIKKDGTLWGWGRNYDGMLADGTDTTRYSAIHIGIAENWDYVSAGYQHNLAIKNDGTLWAWGSNVFGQLGDGTTKAQKKPIQIGIETNWTKVCSANEFSIAIKNDGTIWAWGKNAECLLGIGDTNSVYKKSPMQISQDNDWKDVFSSYNHSFAIKKNGTLWAWGINVSGELGIGDTNINRRSTPVQISKGTFWTKVSCGESHTIALKSDSTIWTWGDNRFGQLGDGSQIKRSEPVQIGTENNWINISCGAAHNFAMKKDSTIWGWGMNSYMQLGDSTIIDKYSPVQFDSDTKWEFVTCGGLHTIILSKKLITSVFDLSNKRKNISLNIKPNPAIEVVEIEFSTPFIENTEISIYSIDGKLIDKIQNLTGNSTIYNTSKLSLGEYSVVITCGKEKATQKLVVVR
jgi:alpha-tubulin suppressor-like RCC1 family protein